MIDGFLIMEYNNYGCVIAMYKESQNLELKREVNSNLCKEIIAFANTNGGTIYIGYDDEANLIGIENAKEELDRISNLISDSIEPNIVFNVSLDIVEEFDKEIIVIKVLKGTQRPYYLKSKGMTSEGVFLRFGATNRKATRDEIAKMIMDDTGVKFEDNISKNQKLTFTSLRKEFEERNIQFDKTKMKNLGMMTNDGLYTNLGLIVSDQNIYPIKLAIYKGNDKVEFLDKKELENMSVFEQLHEAERFMNLFIKIPAKIVGMKRIESPEYNLEVIRESLLNSIIHRDYSVDASTLISIYEDSIEVVNIGGLIGGLTVEAIKKGTSANRNPKLASLFHRLEYVDAYGSGIPRILAKYQYQTHKPLIETDENSFFIRFPKIDGKSEKENEQIQLMKEIYSKNKKILREDIEEIYNCSKVTAVRKIKSLIEIGILVRVGNGKNIYYEMK